MSSNIDHSSNLDHSSVDLQLATINNINESQNKIFLTKVYKKRHEQ